MRIALLLTVALVACNGSAPKEPTPPEPTPVAEPEPTPEPEPEPTALPGQGEKCPEGKCDEGLECIEYYGIAGTKGPKFTSCEIRCKADGDCPQGQKCTAIGDGPGVVCRSPR